MKYMKPIGGKSRMIYPKVAIITWYDYKLSDGSSGTTNMDKKEFKKMLKKGIKIRGWKKK